MQTDVIFTQDIKHNDAPSLTSSMLPLAHANRSVLPYLEYPSKTITVSGFIKGADIPTTDSLVDTFKGYFNGLNRNLDIGYNGSVRRYIATATDVKADRPGGLAYANFTVTFVATRPFGQDIVASVPINVMGRTASTYSDTVVFIGSAPYQLPVITITYTAVTAATNGSVSIGNNSNGQQITVQRTWVAGDVFAVDSYQQQVTVNGLIYDFTGAFPEFQPGVQSIAYSDSFGSRTFNENVAYYAEWK